jgi:hypothetical protein
VAGVDVEDALVDVARLWVADYLAELERLHGLEVGYLPLPRS